MLLTHIFTDLAHFVNEEGHNIHLSWLLLPFLFSTSLVWNRVHRILCGKGIQLLFQANFIIEIRGSKRERHIPVCSHRLHFVIVDFSVFWGFFCATDSVLFSPKLPTLLLKSDVRTYRENSFPPKNSSSVQIILEI